MNKNTRAHLVAGAIVLYLITVVVMTSLSYKTGIVGILISMAVTVYFIIYNLVKAL